MSIVTKSGQTLVLKEDDSKALDYAEGKRRFPFARIFDYIVKENRSQLLEKLTFIDTPGLGRNFQHSEPTISALHSCDAVIWFVKVPDSISNNDLKFIQENIGKELYMSFCHLLTNAKIQTQLLRSLKIVLSKAVLKFKSTSI